MAQMIHARKTENGEFRFRLWSTVTDSYISEEMTETEVREWTLKEAVCAVIEQHCHDIDNRIQRTREKGTSSLMGDTRDLNAPWDGTRKKRTRT